MCAGDLYCKGYNFETNTAGKCTVRPTDCTKDSDCVGSAKCLCDQGDSSKGGKCLY